LITEQQHCDNSQVAAVLTPIKMQY